MSIAAAPRILRTRITFAAVAVSFAAVTSLQSLLVPVLVVIGDDLHADAIGVTWTLTVWLITAAVATPLLGRAGDLIGRRRVFLLALAAIAVGSVIAAFAPDLTVLLIARVIQGLGGAIFPLGFGLIRDVFPAKRMAAAIGALSTIMAVGSGLGTVIAGPVADAFGWRFLFALPLILSAGALVIAYRYMGESARQPGIGLNPVAAILLSGWLVALLLPLSAGNTWGWNSPLVIGLLLVAVVLAVAWVVVELRARNPLVDMRMMRIPGVWTTNLAGLLLGASMFGMWAYLPRLAETPASTGYGLGATVTAAGIIMLPMLVTMGTMGLLAGPLSRVLPFGAQLSIGSFLSAAAGLSMALLHENAVQLAIAAAVFGVGLGLSSSSAPNLIVRSVPAGQVGIATGMNTNIRTIGGAVGTTIFSAVIGATVGASGFAAEGGYIAAFVVGAALAAAAGIAPFFARPRRIRTLPEPTQPEPYPVAVTPLAEAEAAV